MPVRLMSRQLTTLILLMVFTFYLTRRCWLGFVRSPVLPADLANTAVSSPGCSPKACVFISFSDYPHY